VITTTGPVVPRNRRCWRDKYNRLHLLTKSPEFKTDQHLNTSRPRSLLWRRRLMLVRSVCCRVKQFYYTTVQKASHFAVEARDAYSSFHRSLSHRNATNVAPLWDGNLQGNRAVRAGISRMAALVYTVPRVDLFCSLVCFAHIYFCRVFVNLLHAFTLQFPPLMISHFLSRFHSKCSLRSIKNEFIVIPSAANNDATEANIGPGDKAQCIL
jgi:hypothetical protein